MTKAFLTVVLVTMGSGFAIAQKASTTAAPLPSFRFFEGVAHNYLNVPVNTTTSYPFRFKNRGKAALIISEVTSSCECLTFRFSAEPVPPGGQGQIDVTYVSSEKTGPFSEKVSVNSNAPGASGGQVTELTVTGTVVP